jgi:hypothetical protein
MRLHHHGNTPRDGVLDTMWLLSVPEQHPAHAARLAGSIRQREISVSFPISSSVIANSTAFRHSASPRLDRRKRGIRQPITRSMPATFMSRSSSCLGEDMMSHQPNRPICYQIVKLLAAGGPLFLTLMLTVAHARSDDALGTIVFIRHGEKPDEGLGQLTCQGLNRALALPKVIHKLFGKPDAIFAPNPSSQKEDSGKSYYYVRPLATVEPTAIQFGLPVHTSLDYSDEAGLQSALESRLSSNSKNTVILVAWEHKVIQTVARALLAAHRGDPETVPKWHGKDFDSIFVIIIPVGDGKATFVHEYEHLDKQPKACQRR